MKILLVPILSCFRCGNNFAPKIDTVKELVIIPIACPQRNCRSKTWNIPDDELLILNRNHGNQYDNNRYGRQITTRKVTVLDKYKPKKPEKKPLIICQECEIFYFDQDSLERHQHRRHYGMCMKCHTSNVYVMIVHGKTICKTCLESKDDIL